MTLGRSRRSAGSAGVPLVMVIIPRVGKADARRPRAEPVARLKAIAAHQGLTVFDLSDTFDQFDPAQLEIAAWDDHPNAIGHRRLFLALARAWSRTRSLSIAFRSRTTDPNGSASRHRRMNGERALVLCRSSESKDRGM